MEELLVEELLAWEVAVVATKKLKGHPDPKKITLIDSTIFSNTDASTAAPGGIPWINYAPDKEVDLLRYRMGACWDKKGNPAIFSQFSAQMVGEAEKMENGSDFFQNRENILIDKVPSSEARNGGRFDVTEQPGTTTKISSIQKWVSYIDQDQSQAGQESYEIVSTFSKLRNEAGRPTVFYDHVCNIEIPRNKKEIENKFYGSLRVFQASIDPIYNFYIQSYEDAIWKFEPNELVLPNFYSFLSVLQAEDDDPEALDTIFEKQVNLGGALQNPGGTANHFIEKEVLNKRGEKTGKTTKTSKGQYFDKYAYSLHKINKKKYIPARKNIERRFKNLIAPITNLNLFTDYNDMAERFPMYFDINFSTDINTEMAEVLKDSRLSSILLKDIANNETIAQTNMNFNFFPSENVPFVPNPTKNVSDVEEKEAEATDYSPVVGATSFINQVGGTPLKCWDMSDWYNDVVKKPVDAFKVEEGQNLSTPVFLGKYNDEINMASGDSSYNFFKNLMVLIFAGKFRKMVNKKTRTFKQILLGNKAHHETVLYKIEKWAVGPNKITIAGDKPIQTFYLPNSREIDMHRFIDTQIKYGEQYIYRIYAYEMIFGTAYHYLLDALPTDAKDTQKKSNIKLGQAQVCVFTKPSLKLVEIPYFEKRARMIDAPPVWSDVDIIPYRGVKDKLLFFFRGNVGEYKLKPILIQPTDEERINRVLDAQKDIVGLPEGIVQYRSDDQARIFEVFRTDKKPTSYIDFANLKHAHVITDQFDTPCKMATGGSFVDTLLPNKKYYYTFRTIDNHKHFSNPSPVYEVEIVYDAGAPFLLTRIITDGHDFKKEKNPPQMPTKSVKKYIRIRPAAIQSIINYDASVVPIVDGERTQHKPLIDKLGNQAVKSLKDVKVLENTIHLGAEDETLWGKKFKIRIVSQKTGRKIDLNINFKQKHQNLDKNANTNILCEK